MIASIRPMQPVGGREDPEAFDPRGVRSHALTDWYAEPSSNAPSGMYRGQTGLPRLAPQLPWRHLETEPERRGDLAELAAHASPDRTGEERLARCCDLGRCTLCTFAKPLRMSCTGVRAPGARQGSFRSPRSGGQDHLAHVGQTALALAAQQQRGPAKPRTQS